MCWHYLILAFVVGELMDPVVGPSPGADVVEDKQVFLMVTLSHAPPSPDHVIWPCAATSMS